MWYTREDFLLCFVSFLLLLLFFFFFFTFAYKCLICRFSFTLGEHGAHLETPQRLNQTCLRVLASCRGSGQQWPATGTGALRAADLHVAEALLEVIITDPTVELPALTQDWRNRLLEIQK